MLRNAAEIDEYTLAASDGDIGTVSDLLFDDSTWLVRWLVVDTGNWLPGRKVLLPATVLGHLDPLGGKFAVRLTRQQITDSPGVNTERPVSRQMETNIYDYYGWNPYWSTGFYMGGYGYGGGAIVPSPYLGAEFREGETDTTSDGSGTSHLRSIQEVTGYHIHASDGDIGHVADMLVEDADWSIHYLVVDTSNWWLGRKVLISPRSVRAIDWAERHITLDVDRERVKESPAYDPSTLVDRGYERDFHRHYAELRPRS